MGGEGRAIENAVFDVVSAVYGMDVKIETGEKKPRPFTPRGRSRLLESLEGLVEAIRNDAACHNDNATLDRIASGIGVEENLMRTLGGTD